jgi:small subunit ribosomal protein S9
LSEQTTSVAPGAAPEAPAKGRSYFWGTGRRKTSVARVRLSPGSGKFMIGPHTVEKFFFSPQTRSDVVAPLKATNTLGKYDIFVNVCGGGQTGQSGAILLGVARALAKADPSLEPALRDGKYLTRDARKVERKKPGRPGARKRFQFSKR